jgi:hypothetical protein
MNGIVAISTLIPDIMTAQSNFRWPELCLDIINHSQHYRSIPFVLPRINISYKYLHA